MFGRQTNTRTPPSSFPKGPGPGNNRLPVKEQNSRRLSGIDFEEALRKDETLRLTESVDVDELGADISLISTSSPLSSPQKQPITMPQPMNMNIVPPTPSPDRKRPSVYRQKGSASSPDLASSYLKSKSKQQPPVPPLPTSSNGASSVTSSPRPKGTVRAKTSAFLGKLMGQGSFRERAKTEPTFPDGFGPPPVPPLPSDISQPVESPSTSPSPIADAFTSVRAVDHSSKPLPPITLSPVARRIDDEENSSIVLVNKPSRTPSPASFRSKRRSMSVGDTDLRAIIASSPSMHHGPTLSPHDESSEKTDPSRKNLLADLQGDLSTLDSERSPTLELKDPSTPGRIRRTYPRSHTDSSLHNESDRPEIRSTLSSPATSPLLQPSTANSHGYSNHAIPDSPTTPATAPIRMSSLNATGTFGIARQTSSGSLGATNPSMRSKGARLSVQGPRDPNRLRVHHRPSASNSEPSLVSKGEDASTGTGTGVSSRSGSQVGSQQDLTMSPSNLTSFPSSSSQSLEDKSDDSADILTRGKDRASKCFNEDEDFLAKEKIAEWLGGHGELNKVALHFYMQFFDFAGLRLDVAFRRLCAKLYLKAETQQVDRILEEFSKRYWTCNNTTVYGSANIVHAVSYSLLLLNTDLHVAELATRMSRTQFVRNTITAIQMQLENLPRDTHGSNSDLGHDDLGATAAKSGSDVALEASATIRPRTKRSDSLNSWSSVTKDAIARHHSPSPGRHSNGSMVSIQGSAPAQEKYGRAWEIEMEALLKEMYTAIKSQQILQPLSSGPARLSTSSLNPGGPTLIRQRSLRGPSDRGMLKRGSIRGLQSILGNQPGSSPYSSNSSIDGRVSPSPSFAASTHEALYGSNSFLTPTLGFASNLSHTIIKEAQEDDEHRSSHSVDSDSTNISISDEELALLGAPWAKEGMLCRKQYWEASGKRAKDKSWLDVFVVIQKGELNMFTFGEHASAGRGIFGGGNWLANADAVGTVHLSHSLAHALPPPGYNRQRPHCMVLTLSNGGVYFFQAGTEELVNEWVSTCNYWAARTSKEPLAGGVSNMEYGWNRVSDPVHGRSQSDSESLYEDPSDALSVKSGRSGRSRFGSATVRSPSSPWADRAIINDWKPPMHPTVASVHDEETQMEALQRHVASMKRDIKRHNELREPMLQLYSSRSANSLKAQSNWEKKSRYLLAEIVKYDSYVESLKAAMSLRLKKRGEKALEHALRGTSPMNESPSREQGNVDEELLTPASASVTRPTPRRAGTSE